MPAMKYILLLSCFLILSSIVLTQTGISSGALRLDLFIRTSAKKTIFTFRKVVDEEVSGK
jgi:hypothetical protein